ncbi:MAG: Crp/Fnr family transcriptional regulator [Anaerolineae bacterium]|nr:Crp/Fnr family transcriptional regulator [Anaerolineae bacterium]
MIRCMDPAVFRKIPAFNQLGTPALNALLEISHLHELKGGEQLLHRGDLMRAFYIIQSGGVRLMNYGADGQAFALKLYGEGDIFGLLTVSSPYPHPNTIEAVKDSVIISTDGQQLRKLILRFPELGLLIVDLLAVHIHEGHQRVQHMATRRVDRRIAHCLMKLSDKFGQQEASHISLDVPLSQRDLAEFANTTVETVNRTLTVWEKEGVLACSHKHIDILDYNYLKTLVEDTVPA